MPLRSLRIDDQDWTVHPSGFVTQSLGDEFGLIFVRGEGDAREVRVTRYSPAALGPGLARDRSLAGLDDAELTRLFRMSQSSARSPEAGYRA